MIKFSPLFAPTAVMRYFLLPLILYLFAMVPVDGICQSDTAFVPLKENEALRTAQLQELKNRYQSDIGSLSGSYKKGISNIYKERYETLKSYLDDSLIVTDKTVNEIGRAHV